MDTITIILNTAPYGDERVWNALRLAKALIGFGKDMKVNIFLTGDSVVTAKRGQRPPEGFYNLEKMLKELVDHSVEVVSCRTCVATRGLAKDDLIEGVKIGTTTGDLAKWVKESQKVLSF